MHCCWSGWGFGLRLQTNQSRWESHWPSKQKRLERFLGHGVTNPISTSDLWSTMSWAQLTQGSQQESIATAGVTSPCIKKDIIYLFVLNLDTFNFPTECALVLMKCQSKRKQSERTRSVRKRGSGFGGWESLWWDKIKKFWRRVFFCST